jgi:GntR family transcriptional regulator
MVKARKSIPPRDVLADGPVPLYAQIARLLRAEARTPGDWPRRLGSDNELVARFGVSRMTIRSAVDELVRQGLVRRIHGKGTFVVGPVEVRLDGLERFLQEWHEPHLHTRAQILTFRTIVAPSAVSQALGIAAGSRVLHVRRLRESIDAPVVIDDRYVPAWCAKDITREDAARQSLFVSIEEHSGVRTESVEQTITAILASNVEARLLKLEPNAPLLERQVVFFTAGSRPTLCGRSVYRGDRVRFQLRAARGEAAATQPS